MNTTEAITLTYQFADLTALKRAFMPFVQDGGIFIPTDQVFHLKDMVTIAITLPESDHTFVLTGEIIWMTPASTQHPGIGIQCNSDEGGALHKAIRELLAELKDDGSESSDTM